MAILGFMHAQDLLTNNYTAVTDKISWGKVKPGVLASVTNDNNSIYRQESFYRKFMLKVGDAGSQRYFPSYYSQNPRDGFWAEVPADSSELWLRLYQMRSYAGTTYDYLEYSSSQLLLEFWNWNGTRMKKVADIVLPATGGSGLVLYRVFAETEGVDTVTRTHSLGARLCLVWSLCLRR
jgi:hypothetical protein